MFIRNFRFSFYLYKLNCSNTKEIRIYLRFQEEGWKLNRNHYYQEGWLSTANLRGVVGVTYTTSHCGGSGFLEPSCEKYLNLEPPNRTNYNLRGHRAEVRKSYNPDIKIYRFVIRNLIIVIMKIRIEQKLCNILVIYTTTDIPINF